jgi:hypothetical protein
VTDAIGPRLCECEPWKRERNWFSRVFAWLNGEVLLARWANCGTVIAARAIWSSIVVALSALLVWNLVNPDRILEFNLRELRLQILRGLPWFSTVLAATYAAFYTRYASQWSYVAQLFNSIKTAECALPDKNDRKALVEWQAAFLEDCDELHLARKASATPRTKGIHRNNDLHLG